jgi:hypothetical protein
MCNVSLAMLFVSLAMLFTEYSRFHYCTPKRGGGTLLEVINFRNFIFKKKEIPTSCTMKIQVVSFLLAIGGANAKAVRC